MSDEIPRPRPSPTGQQELPPPPRLVQYGLSPTRQPDSRQGGGAGGTELLPVREDLRLDAERRQQLAHSIQLLQQKAAQQQQQARLAAGRSGVSLPMPATSASATEQLMVAGVSRATRHQAQPAFSGHASHPAVVVTQIQKTGGQMQVASDGQNTATLHLRNAVSDGGAASTNPAAPPAHPAVPTQVSAGVKAPTPQPVPSDSGTTSPGGPTAQLPHQVRNGASHVGSLAAPTAESVPLQTAAQTSGPDSQRAVGTVTPPCPAVEGTDAAAPGVTGTTNAPDAVATGHGGDRNPQLTGPSDVPVSQPTGPPAAPLAPSQPNTSTSSPVKRASPMPDSTEPAVKRPRSDSTDAPAAAAATSPTHKGKKSWLTRLTSADQPANGAVPDSGSDSSAAERPADTAPASDRSLTSDGSKSSGDQPAADTDEGSSGDNDMVPSNAEQNGVLAPRAAAAATKAAAAAKRGPGRPRKKTPADPTAPKRPSVMTLKKSGESFAQTNFCCQITAKLPRCRECRVVPNQRHSKPTSIYCRFTAFRRVRYTRTGQLTVTGFCDPYSDTSGESDRLWRAGLDGRPTMEPEMAKFLLAHVGNQFCDLVCDEEAARACHMAQDKTVAWKRVVQGCREMCDVCETTLFNVHWVCSKCGFAVCVDCYRGRRDGTVKDWGEPVAERDQYRWLLCGLKPHEQDKLILTQIVAGDALATLNRQVHEARQLAGLPFTCQCDEARRLQERAADGAAALKTEPDGGGGVKREGDAGDAADGEVKRPAGSPLAFLADVALSNIPSDDSDSDSDDDAGGGSLTLRRLLVPDAQAADNKPKPIKKERQERPKRAGWSMEDSLDEVLDKVSARCGAAPPSSHAASGPAALRHFVRRCASKRGLRERLPIRIMTLGESTRLYPAVRHSWLCDGKLLRLHESTAADSVRLFRDQWKRGQPVLCSGIGGSLDRSLWSVDAFIRDFGDVRNDLINCRTGNIVPNQPMRRFWEGFECVSRRLRDDKGQPMILKLKDWPPGEDFADMMPKRFADLMSVLPMTDYTRRDGRLNLASCLPDCFVRPDLGPKMYIAYGCALHPSKASTNLHLDISDAVNIMVYVGIPPDGDADNAEALRAIDEAGCDQLTKRRVRDEMPGALWHIYHAADADKIRDLLNKVAIERGDQLEPHHDPIHDQSWYLDGPLRRRLYEEYRVEGYPIVQCAGDAVFIPAGAPHQVRNLHSCIKVAEDFVSPENIGHCFDLTQEFRSLSDTHTNHEDKLQIKNIIYHAMKDAVSCLLGSAQSVAPAAAETAASTVSPAAPAAPAAPGTPATPATPA